jgi:tRNA-2-methylthio-N6-dimethylallyladenosine synthase
MIAQQCAGYPMPKKYHFWISGCQMNYADARQVAVRLDQLGYQATQIAEEADVILLQTCTVRQQAEDRAHGRLQSLRPLKEERPELTLALMGCVVGVKGNQVLEKRYPYVDVWMPPASDGEALISHLLQDEDRYIEEENTKHRHALQDGDLVMPLHQKGELVSAPVAVVYGCSHACSFCIIPNRRGVERTRRIGEVVAEVRSLVQRGVKEVVLLGQIIDRYGKDVPDGPDLADLLRVVNDVEGLDRIRFLTSHPNYMTDRILEAVVGLPKVMPQIEIPVQSGDDEVLANMKRGYSAEDYCRLVGRIREMVPDAAIHTDIIVGFPGETTRQFQNTYQLLAKLEVDKVHLARYSPRSGTVSERRMIDDVPDDEKRRRFQAIELMQKDISTRKMARWMGEIVEVLVEDKPKDRWRGRSRHGKLVFFNHPGELKGETLRVRITHAGPWSMSGEPVVQSTSLENSMDSIPLSMI